MKYRNQYKLFKVSLTATYKVSLTAEQLREIFENLVKVTEFDGAKNFDIKSKYLNIQLSSIDNKMFLYSNKDRLTLEYVYDIFGDNKRESNQVNLAKLLNGVIKKINSDIDFVHYRRVWTGLSRKLRDEAIAHLINPAFINQIEDLNIDLDLAGDAMKPSRYVKVTTSHTDEMSEVFKKHEKRDLLDDLIVFDETHLIGDGLSLGDVYQFLESEAERKVTGPET